MLYIKTLSIMLLTPFAKNKIVNFNFLHEKQCEKLKIWQIHVISVELFFDGFFMLC